MTARAAARGNQVIAEEGLDKPPSAGIIGVVRGQCPNGMQMVGQHNNRSEREWTLQPGSAKRCSQSGDLFDGGG
jgi:hypothetical protein